MLNKEQLKTRINNIRDSINRSEEYLVHKKKNLENNPDSIFYQGALKNAIEFIDEMKENLKKYENDLEEGNYGKDNS